MTTHQINNLDGLGLSTDKTKPVRKTFPAPHIATEVLGAFCSLPRPKKWTHYAYSTDSRGCVEKEARRGMLYVYASCLRLLSSMHTQY